RRQVQEFERRVVFVQRDQGLLGIGRKGVTVDLHVATPFGRYMSTTNGDGRNRHDIAPAAPDTLAVRGDRMAHSEAQPADIRSQHPLWDERDAVGRRAMLTEILAQVSHEALQGDTLEAVLRAIVDCITR